MFEFLNYQLENNIFLAPMAGITDLSFRLMCKKMGAGLVFSEMVSAKALFYNDKKTLSLLETRACEAPLVVQIFGSEPDIMAYSAKKLQDMGVKLLDINFGCPAPKITSNGEGSSLLKNPKLMGEIVSKVSGSVDIPVMCKIRAGFDDFIPLAPIAHILEDSGAVAITVHPRTRKMFYSGKAMWDKISEVKSAVKIPVIGNGDITDGKSAAQMLEQTHCDAIMIGRGAQGNPFIFSEIQAYINGKAYTKPTDAERLELMKEHLALMIALKGERIAIKEARKHIAWYTKGMHGGATFRMEVFKTEGAEILYSKINEYMDFISKRNEI